MDRLADGADRLREILDRMMGRHVTRLEMNFGGPAPVAVNEAEEDLGEELALLRPEPSHDAAIDRDQASIGIDEKISRVQIGMEKPVADRLLEKRSDQHAGQPNRIVAGGEKGCTVRQRDAVDPFDREYAPRGAFPIDGGHAEIRIVLGVFGKLRKSRGFEPKIHLDRDRARERFDDGNEPQAPRLHRMALGAPGREKKGIEVALETVLDLGSQHLDRDGAYQAVGIVDLGAMNLRDRSGGDRGPELFKQLRNRLAETLRDGGFRFRLQKWRHAVLQRFEIARDRDADDIGPRRQELAKLDVRGPEPGEGHGETHGAGTGIAALDHPRQAQ